MLKRKKCFIIISKAEQEVVVDYFKALHPGLCLEWLTETKKISVKIHLSRIWGSRGGEYEDVCLLYKCRLVW
jgi:hypothetical protein